MISTLHRRLTAGVHARGGDDAGFAMILVMGSLVTLTLLVTLAIGVSTNGQKTSRNDQDWQAALAAAQAGVDDYAARLNANGDYWKTVDCTNTALKGPAAEQPNTCGWTSATAIGWTNVEALDEQSAQFHYEANTGQASVGGGIRLNVTGRSRNETRTIQVRVGKEGSTKFVYYTDFEDADPGNRTAYPSTSLPSVECGLNGTTGARYYYTAPTSSRRSGCTEITFLSTDSLDGKVHFNDTPKMQDGADFLDGYETADPSCKTGTRANNWAGCSRTSSSGVGSYSAKPDIPTGYSAVYASPLYLADNSDSLLTRKGCHYTGDTRIKFISDGTMRVWSALTTSVETGCGTPGATGLGSSAGQIVNVPNNDIVYAKNSGSAAECTAGKIGDGLPLAGDNSFKGADNQTFYCGQGNIYVEGTVKGAVGIGAQNNVIVTGDLLLDGVAKGATPTGPNIAALVASNSVVVYHPIKDGTCKTTNNKGVCTAYNQVDMISATDRYIYASIQTLQHSFWVQSYNEGTSRGKLIVIGSIAQRWRGIVGTSGGNTGYVKDYRYDQRLTNVVPPAIIDFSNGIWGTSVTGEIKPVYTCSGVTKATSTCSTA